MRAGFGQFKEATPEYLRFAGQYGATDVLLNNPELPGAGGRWELHDLVKLRLAVEQNGLQLSAIENVPTNFYDQIILAGPNRDEQIENMIYTVRNIARAGIPIFGYNWMPSHVWRTTPAVIRCGALATAFDSDTSPPTVLSLPIFLLLCRTRCRRAAFIDQPSLASIRAGRRNPEVA